MSSNKTHLDHFDEFNYLLDMLPGTQDKFLNSVHSLMELDDSDFQYVYDNGWLDVSSLISVVTRALMSGNRSATTSGSVGSAKTQGSARSMPQIDSHSLAMVYCTMLRVHLLRLPDDSPTAAMQLTEFISMTFNLVSKTSFLIVEDVQLTQKQTFDGVKTPDIFASPHEASQFQQGKGSILDSSPIGIKKEPHTDGSSEVLTHSLASVKPLFEGDFGNGTHNPDLVGVYRQSIVPSALVLAVLEFLTFVVDSSIFKREICYSADCTSGLSKFVILCLSFSLLKRSTSVLDTPQLGDVYKVIRYQIDTESKLESFVFLLSSRLLLLIFRKTSLWCDAPLEDRLFTDTIEVDDVNPYPNGDLYPNSCPMRSILKQCAENVPITILIAVVIEQVIVEIYTTFLRVVESIVESTEEIDRNTKKEMLLAQMREFAPVVETALLTLQSMKLSFDRAKLFLPVFLTQTILPSILVYFSSLPATFDPTSVADEIFEHFESLIIARKEGKGYLSYLKQFLYRDQDECRRMLGRAEQYMTNVSKRDDIATPQQLMNCIFVSRWSFSAINCRECNIQMQSAHKSTYCRCILMSTALVTSFSQVRSIPFIFKFKYFMDVLMTQAARAHDANDLDILYSISSCGVQLLCANRLSVRQDANSPINMSIFQTKYVDRIINIFENKGIFHDKSYHVHHHHFRDSKKPIDLRTMAAFQAAAICPEGARGIASLADPLEVLGGARKKDNKATVQLMAMQRNYCLGFVNDDDRKFFYDKCLCTMLDRLVSPENGFTDSVSVFTTSYNIICLLIEILSPSFRLKKRMQKLLRQLITRKGLFRTASILMDTALNRSEAPEINLATICVVSVLLSYLLRENLLDDIEIQELIMSNGIIHSFEVAYVLLGLKVFEGPRSHESTADTQTIKTGESPGQSFKHKKHEMSRRAKRKSKSKVAKEDLIPLNFEKMRQSIHSTSITTLPVHQEDTGRLLGAFSILFTHISQKSEVFFLKLASRNGLDPKTSTLLFLRGCSASVLICPVHAPLKYDRIVGRMSSLVYHPQQPESRKRMIKSVQTLWKDLFTVAIKLLRFTLFSGSDYAFEVGIERPQTSTIIPPAVASHEIRPELSGIATKERDVQRDPSIISDSSCILVTKEVTSETSKIQDEENEEETEETEEYQRPETRKVEGIALHAQIQLEPGPISQSIPLHPDYQLSSSTSPLYDFITFLYVGCDCFLTTNISGAVLQHISREMVRVSLRHGKVPPRSTCYRYLRLMLEVLPKMEADKIWSHTLLAIAFAVQGLAPLYGRTQNEQELIEELWMHITRERMRDLVNMATTAMKAVKEAERMTIRGQAPYYDVLRADSWTKLLSAITDAERVQHSYAFDSTLVDRIYHTLIRIVKDTELQQVHSGAGYALLRLTSEDVSKNIPFCRHDAKILVDACDTSPATDVLSNALYRLVLRSPDILLWLDSRDVLTRVGAFAKVGRSLSVLSAENAAYPFPETASPNLLSLDGGGIRGLSELSCLIELERLTGYRSAALFDHVIGTSTGSIVTSAVFGAQMPAVSVQWYFLHLGMKIFSASNATRNTRIFLSGFAEQYSSIELGCFFKTAFGNRNLQQLIGCRPKITLVASDARTKDTSVLFRNFSLQSTDESQLNTAMRTNEVTITTAKLWEATRASTAAPVFFKPMIIDGRSYADGGIVANNPTLLSLSTSTELFPKTNPQICVSIGTGQKHHERTSFSMFSWLLSALSIAMDSSKVHMYAKDLCKTSKIKYYRLDPALAATEETQGVAITMDEGDEKVLNQWLRTLLERIDLEKDIFRKLAKQLVASMMVCDGVKCKKAFRNNRALLYIPENPNTQAFDFYVESRVRTPTRNPLGSKYTVTKAPCYDTLSFISLPESRERRRNGDNSVSAFDGTFEKEYSADDISIEFEGFRTQRVETLVDFSIRPDVVSYCVTEVPPRANTMGICTDIPGSFRRWKVEIVTAANITTLNPSKMKVKFQKYSVSGSPFYASLGIEDLCVSMCSISSLIKKSTQEAVVVIHAMDHNGNPIRVHSNHVVMVDVKFTGTNEQFDDDGNLIGEVPVEHSAQLKASLREDHIGWLLILPISRGTSYLIEASIDKHKISPYRFEVAKTEWAIEDEETKIALQDEKVQASEPEAVETGIGIGD